MTEQLDQDTPPPQPEDLVDLRLLPPGLRTLCRLLGHRKAFELCKQRGGVPMTVPVSLSVEHYLAPIIGMDGMAVLVAEMGGMTVDVPKYDSVAMQLRHRAAHALLNQGKTLTSVALQTGYTKRQIVNLKRGMNEPLNTQEDLFGFLPADVQVDIERELAGVGHNNDGPIEAIDDKHKAAATRKNRAHNPFGI